MVAAIMATDSHTAAFIMKVEVQPSDREVLAGLVERVTYHNADNGFCVVRVKARGHRDLVTLVGHAAAISAGEWITATGGWEPQKCSRRFPPEAAPDGEVIERVEGRGSTGNRVPQGADRPPRVEGPAAALGSPCCCPLDKSE